MIGGNGGCGGRQLRQLRNPFCLYQNMFCCTIHVLPLCLLTLSYTLLAARAHGLVIHILRCCALAGEF